MRASVALPTHRVDVAELLTADAIGAVARAAESAGFDAVFVTDHPFPDDAWLAHGGHHTLDPFVALAAAAAATSTLRLQTNLFIPAYRNPHLAAKAVATLDVLSGGRVILGVGAGYLEGEFAGLGADFERRNEVTDEAIIAMREAWSGGPVARGGGGANSMLPQPVQRPHPPIWVGGNSRRAIRRAVELGDGWAPMPNPARFAARRRTPALESLDDLRGRLAYAHEHASAVGRGVPLEVVFMPLGLDMFDGRGAGADAVVEGVGEMAAAGVTYMACGVPGDTPAEIADNLTRSGDEVLANVAEL